MCGPTLVSSICTFPIPAHTLHSHTALGKLLHNLQCLATQWTGSSLSMLHVNIYHISTLPKLFLSGWVRIFSSGSEVEKKKCSWQSCTIWTSIIWFCSGHPDYLCDPTKDTAYVILFHIYVVNCLCAC